jgi:acetylornithine deacetylase/succinyl-diaminopimelate desuccinylase-like protein
MRRNTRHARRAASALLALLTFAFPLAPRARAQQGAGDQGEKVKAILARADIKKAFEQIDAGHESILREWIAITEINAPSGKEKRRAAYVESILRKQPSLQVRYDRTGNLVAVRKGTGGGPTVVIDAHLDTVFQPGQKIKVEVKQGRAYAPGIGDDTRNVEAMLATVRALDAAGVKTKGDLVFVFTVEEETSLRGAEEFVKDNKGKVDFYVALDGGYEGFTYGGIGINWYKHHFIGPGGHTRSRNPPYSAALPLARAIERIYKLELPDDPPTHVNVGMLGGAEVVNAKASDAWFTVDLRSTSNEVMADLEKKIADIVREEAEREKMSVKTDIISQTPAARIPGLRESAFVKTVEAVHREMGLTGPITDTGSNNSIAALLAGIPAISTGAGPCGNSHAVTEWCDIEPLYNGIKKVLMLGVALSQPSGR